MRWHHSRVTCEFVQLRFLSFCFFKCAIDSVDPSYASPWWTAQPSFFCILFNSGHIARACCSQQHSWSITWWWLPLNYRDQHTAAFVKWKVFLLVWTSVADCVKMPIWQFEPNPIMVCNTPKLLKHSKSCSRLQALKGVAPLKKKKKKIFLVSE